jgi:hypothetical protein
MREYTARGSLNLFRFDEVVQFQCRYCGKDKTAKLIATHDGDWAEPICNACYGNTLAKTPLVKRAKPYPALREEYGPFVTIMQGGLPSLGKRR